ncbi:MAG: WD40 repeat domain-containing protein [Verrucomicrobia bacterium]|nr:WD40 repeat domain-containing protein [Verrucomicrobiota bacterium]
MAAVGPSLYPSTYSLPSPKSASIGPVPMECFKTLKNDTAGITAVVPFSDGRFASGSYDSKIMVWNHDGEPIDTFWNDYFNVRALAPISDTLLACGLAGIPNGRTTGIVKLWDLHTKDSQILGTYQTDITALAVSPEKRLASGDRLGFFNIFNPFSKKLEIGSVPTGSQIWSLAFVQNGKMLATGQTNGEILFWDSHTGKFLKSFKMHKDAVTALTVLPDGTLVSGSFDGNIILWDTSKDPSQAWIKTLKSGPVTSLATQGDILVSGSWDKSFTVWDTNTAAFWQSPFTEHQGIIYAVAAFEDRVVTGSEDKTLKLWQSKLKARL